MKCIDDVILNDLHTMKRILFEYPKHEQKLRSEFEKVSGERQDLLHVLELAKLDAIKFTQTSKQLQEVQKKRRDIKNELEVFEELNRHLSFKNQSTKKYDFVIQKIEHVFDRQKNRKYKMRVRDDLQELVEQ